MTIEKKMQSLETITVITAFVLLFHLLAILPRMLNGNTSSGVTGLFVLLALALLNLKLICDLIIMKRTYPDVPICKDCEWKRADGYGYCCSKTGIHFLDIKKKLNLFNKICPIEKGKNNEKETV